jgi:hypothetical protein
MSLIALWEINSKIIDDDDDYDPLKPELIYLILRKLRDYLDFFKLLFLCSKTH